MRRVILRLLLGSLALAAAAGVVAVTLPGRDIMLRVMFTAIVTALAAGLALPLSLMLTRRTIRVAGSFAMSVLVGQFVLALAMIWLEDACGFASLPAGT